MDINIQLQFVHICDNAFLSQEGKVNIIGDFNNITVKKIPNSETIFHSFYIVTNFYVKESGEYKQRITIRPKENNNKITELNSDHRVTKEERFGFIANIGQVFPKYGSYLVDVYLNDQLFASLPLEVIDGDSK